MIKENTNIISFQNQKVRRIEYNGEWWFSIVDIVAILTDSTNPTDYIKKVKQRDNELQKGWGQIITPFPIQTNGGIQKVNCANLKGCFRIIQSIPSKKAEPIKQFLARVGAERIEEIENPEIAQERMIKIYKKKGYSKEWINERIQSIIDGKNLTDEWKNRGAFEEDYQLFTAIMSKATFGLTPKEYKQYKNLRPKESLRDNMDRLELALVNLGEATAERLHKTRNTKGRNNLKIDIIDAGTIAGNTRKQIEKATKKKVISKDNHITKLKKGIKNE